MPGYQASCLQDGVLTVVQEGEHTKQLLKTRFYLNYFTCHSGSDTQSSQKFIPNFFFRQFHIIIIIIWFRYQIIVLCNL